MTIKAHTIGVVVIIVSSCVVACGGGAPPSSAFDEQHAVERRIGRSADLRESPALDAARSREVVERQGSAFSAAQSNPRSDARRRR